MGKWENGKMGNGKWEERVTLRWICNPAAMLAIFCFRIANPKERTNNLDDLLLSDCKSEGADPAGSTEQRGI